MSKVPDVPRKKMRKSALTKNKNWNQTGVRMDDTAAFIRNPESGIPHTQAPQHTRRDV